jgi:hypothetical protein
MELDLQSLFELHCAQGCSHWLSENPQPPPPPPAAFGLIYEGAILQPAKIDDISLRPPGERESTGSESKDTLQITHGKKVHEHEQEK